MGIPSEFQERGEPVAPEAGSEAELLLQPVIDLQAAPYAVKGVAISIELDVVSEAPRQVQEVAGNLAWVASHVRDLDIFLSVGGRALTSDLGLLPMFLEEASRGGLLPTRVVLDLAGPLPAAAGQKVVLETLDRLRNFGVRVSLSRTGLCANGLQLMLALQPDYIWISDSVVAGCGEDFYKRAVVESISRLAWKFGALAAAEGVASAGDAATARDLGVSLAQGPWVGPSQGALALAKEILAGTLPFSVKAASTEAASVIQKSPEVDR